MPARWRKSRKTFRHGHLAEALIQAAIVRLESDGADALSLRELAHDAGVNHRAIYRYFPDKLSLLARVAEDGWRRMERRVQQQAAGKPTGEQLLAAAGVGLFLFARPHGRASHQREGSVSGSGSGNGGDHGYVCSAFHRCRP